MTYYKEGWQIETFFKEMKFSGFNIEAPHVAALERLEKLMMLSMLACIRYYLTANDIAREIKPIKIKKHGRKAKSAFKNGLDCLSELSLSGCEKTGLLYHEIL